MSGEGEFVNVVMGYDGGNELWGGDIASSVPADVVITRLFTHHIVQVEARRRRRLRSTAQEKEPFPPRVDEEELNAVPSAPKISPVAESVASATEAWENFLGRNFEGRGAVDEQSVDSAEVEKSAARRKLGKADWLLRVYDISDELSPKLVGVPAGPPIDFTSFECARDACEGDWRGELTYCDDSESFLVESSSMGLSRIRVSVLSNGTVSLGPVEPLSFRLSAPDSRLVYPNHVSVLTSLNRTLDHYINGTTTGGGAPAGGASRRGLGSVMQAPLDPPIAAESVYFRAFRHNALVNGGAQFAPDTAAGIQHMRDNYGVLGREQAGLSASDRFQTPVSSRCQTPVSSQCHAGCIEVQMSQCLHRPMHRPCHRVLSDLRSHVGSARGPSYRVSFHGCTILDRILFMKTNLKVWSDRCGRHCDFR